MAQTWTGEENCDWNNPGNWSCWPLDNKQLTIDPANLCGECALPEIVNASVFIPSLITIQNGATLFIKNNLTVQEDINIFDQGTQVQFDEGSLKILADKGRLIIADGSALIMHNGLLSLYSPLVVEEGGKFVQSGGTVNLKHSTQ